MLSSFLIRQIILLRCTIYFNSLFLEVHKEEDHHEEYKDVRFLNQHEQSWKMFYHYQATKQNQSFFFLFIFIKTLL
jgi:hypothetical protein